MGIMGIKLLNSNIFKQCGKHGYLNQEFPVLLDVFMGCFLFLFLLSLHWHINVHSQFFTGEKKHQPSIFTNAFTLHDLKSTKCKTLIIDL